MPIFDNGQPNPPAPAVSVRASVVIELEWVLHSAVRKDFADDHRALRALYDDHPELLEEVVGLWEEDGQTGGAGFAELVLAAYHGGLLFTEDPGLLLERLGELYETVPTTVRDFPLSAETDDDRRKVLRRLGRLRRSAETRRHYVDVVGRVWSAASDSWERYGRQAVADAVAAKRAMLAKGAGWRELATGKNGCTGVRDRVVGELGPSGEIVIVPSYFAHVGLLYDVPGFVVLGEKADDTGAEARARTESLARQLRAISDPTRLAILDSLRSGPQTVTELSARFGLAQPTVSNHVKILRDSGIVADVRDGVRRNLVVRRDVVEALMGNLNQVLESASKATSGN